MRSRTTAPYANFEVELSGTSCIPNAMPALPAPSINGDTTYTATAAALTQSCVTWKSYYSGPGGTVERVEYGNTEQTDQVFTLLQDYLNGTHQVVDDQGDASQVRYGVWGAARDAIDDLPTSRLYTGQEKSNTGLYYYGARWYDSELGRFVQPDTIIPDQYNPLDLDRFAYTRNNPVNYSDPTGHWACGDLYDPACAENADERLAWSAATFDVRIKDYFEENSIIPFPDSAFSYDSFVSGPLYSSFWMDELGRGGTWAEQALYDGILSIGHNVDTGMLSLAMGGDVAPIGGVYTLTNPNGVIVRVGQTKDFNMRKRSYKSKNDYFDLDFNPVYYTDNYAERRGLEQYLYEKFGQLPLNKNRPISPINGNRNTYISAASNFLAQLGIKWP